VSIASVALGDDPLIAFRWRHSVVELTGRNAVAFDPVILSRLQFGFVISFHIIFSSFTIGLAAWLATIEGARLGTGKDLSAHIRFLAQNIRAVVRHGRRHRDRHGVPVRHEVKRTGRAHGIDPGTAARLRGVHRLHVGGHVFWCHAAGS
jgi:Cytochrome bd terminal oxidase subunit I